MVINFIGGPSVGKTTLAAKIYATLKQQRRSVGLVTEFATQCIMERNDDIFNYQYYITANQLYRQETIESHYDMVITDSPIILFYVYDPFIDTNLANFYLNKYKEKDNLLFFIERNLDYYTPEGRRSTLEQGLEIDNNILTVLNNLKIDYTTIKNNLNGEQMVLDMVSELYKFGFF